MPIRPHAPRARALRSAAFLLSAGACYTWQPAPLPAPGAAPVRLAGRARLTRTDGRVDELAHVRIERDTVRAERYFTGRGRIAVTVPRDSVRTLEVRAPHQLRSMLVFSAVGLLALCSVLLGP